MYLKKYLVLFSFVVFINVLCISADKLDLKNEIIETPWLVFITKSLNSYENKSDFEPTCMGALIHVNTVLTTATCIHINLNAARNLTVTAYNQSRQVSRVLFHEYNPRHFLHNNYAILILPEPFITSTKLNTIKIAAPGTYIDNKKCTQLTFFEKSSENVTLSKVMGMVEYSGMDYCNQNMYAMYLSYKKTSIFWHASILCGKSLKIDECLNLKDWSAMVTCPNYYEPSMPVLTGFQINYLTAKDNCFFVYSNIYHAYDWIQQSINTLFDMFFY